MRPTLNLPEHPQLQTAIDAVRVAAAVCSNIQHAIAGDVLQKDDRSPVTVADFASQAVVCRALHAAFPEIPITAEEDSADLRRPENRPLLDRVAAELAAAGIEGDSDDICAWIDRGGARADTMSYWTLDPIDGTKGFLRGEQYAVSLALLVEGRIELGVVACPNLAAESGDSANGVLQFAVRGGGTWQAPLGGHAEPVRIHVSDTADPRDARFCESVESKHTAHGVSAKIAERLGIAAEPLRLDSQAKYAVVARGEADAYLRLPTKPGYVEKIWDHAGGVLCVEEAGGRVTDVDGKPLEWTHGAGLSANRGVIVTNGRLHEAVLAAVGWGLGTKPGF